MASPLRKPGAILAMIAGALVLILILQNTEVVSVRLLFWEFSMSRVLLILLTAAAGFIAGYAVALMRSRSRS